MAGERERKQGASEQIAGGGAGPERSWGAGGGQSAQSAPAAERRTESEQRERKGEGRRRRGGQKRGKSARPERRARSRGERRTALTAALALRSGLTPRRLLRAAGGAGPFGNRIANVI